MPETFIAPPIHEIPDHVHSARRCERMTNPADTDAECGKSATRWVLTISPYYIGGVGNGARRVYTCSNECALAEAESDWGIGATFPELAQQD